MIESSSHTAGVLTAPSIIVHVARGSALPVLRSRLLQAILSSAYSPYQSNFQQLACGM